MLFYSNIDTIFTATYIAEDSNQNWISCWDGKEDDIRVENYCSNSNDVVLFGAGQSNQPVREDNLYFFRSTLWMPMLSSLTFFLDR